MKHSSVLTDVRPDGKILYCVALENYTTKACGFEYLHAFNRAEVVNLLLQSNSFRKDTRIAWIAPAIGAHVELDEKDNVKGVIV